VIPALPPDQTRFPSSNRSSTPSAIPYRWSRHRTYWRLRARTDKAPPLPPAATEPGSTGGRIRGSGTASALRPASSAGGRAPRAARRPPSAARPVRCADRASPVPATG